MIISLSPPCKGRRLTTLAVCLAAALGLSAASPSALAANTYFVEICSDGTNPAVGSLRWAVGKAVSGDTIDLGDLTTNCTPSTITLVAGEIVLPQDNLTFQGPTAGVVAIDANSQSRVFHHTGAGTLAINYLTIKNGKYWEEQSSGGCIYSNHTVALSHSTVTGCVARQSSGSDTTARALGGGIFAMGNVGMNNSTVSHSEVDASGDPSSRAAYGGGIYAVGSLVMAYSTIDSNKAVAPTSTDNGAGGGAFVGGGLEMEYSTVSNNSGAVGGGIFQEATVSHSTLITNSTISSNVGVGGIQFSGLITPMTISNSTFAANSQYGIVLEPDNIQLNLQSTIVANNGIGDIFISPGSTSLSGTSANNLVMVAKGNVSLPLDTITTDPQLAPLANHGGATLTHALLPGSPAIGMGSNPSTLQFDQRGSGYFRTIVPKPLSQVTDIGAYQRQLIDDEIFYNGFGPMPGR